MAWDDTGQWIVIVYKWLIVASCHDIKGIGADRLEKKSQEIGAAGSNHDILNGGEGYPDIYLRASDTVSLGVYRPLF